jgi:glycolate oxidase FAD binding subunit
MTTLTPATPSEVLAAVRWAAAEQTPLEIVGHGSKRGIGRPAQAEHTLDLSKLSGVTLYEPAELVLTADAATPLADIDRLLSENGQQLAFEPMDYGPLLGGRTGRGTIGGALAANLAGPRRLKAGAARDHILGINAVSGRGEAFKAGGRVVKNVTGYDLSKALAGSWGTLAVVTEVTFKVLPAAETETTLAIRGLLDDAAAAAMSLPWDRAPRFPARRTCRKAWLCWLIAALGSPAATLLRLEGFPPSIAYRLALLEGLLREAGPLQRIDGERSRALWRDIRDCRPFVDGTDKPVWRVSMPPADAHHMTLALRRDVPATCLYDWQGGSSGYAWSTASRKPSACARLYASMAAAMRRWCARHLPFARRCRCSNRRRRRWPCYRSG